MLTANYIHEVNTFLTKPEELMPKISLFINSAEKLGPVIAKSGDLFQNGIN